MWPIIICLINNQSIVADKQRLSLIIFYRPILIKPMIFHQLIQNKTNNNISWNIFFLCVFFKTSKVLEMYHQLSYYGLVDKNKRTSYFLKPVPILLWRIQILQICVDPIQELDSVWEMQLCYSVISELVGLKTKSRQKKLTRF